MFGRKKSTPDASMDGNTSEEANTNTSDAPCERPLVCLIDCGDAIHEELRRLRFSCFSGSLGPEIEVNNSPRDEKLLKLSYDYPPNLHEFDIVVIDLIHTRRESYNPTDHKLSNTQGKIANALLSKYPEQIFSPIPLAINILSREIKELTTKESIVIAFCGHESVAEYEVVEISSRGHHVAHTTSYSSFGFYDGVPSCERRNGNKVLVPSEGTKLSPLLEKHIGALTYGATFSHPRIRQDGEIKADPKLFPLLINERDEIVSYAHFIGQSLIFVFPDVEDRLGFLGELFNTYLPEIKPALFPFHGQFGWLEDGEYLLPGEQELIDQREQVENGYRECVGRIEESVVELRSRYKFLTDMISGSGDELVSAVVEYLKWLGFESVVNLDTTNPELLEEDIQVDCGDRFLVIEVKGIGGTSTDKDCSQVSKVRFRRAEQRRKFDVFGLYIVNHQRYMPPRSRSNPPFSNRQIRDAELDNRGLLTTYELYKAYFLIEADILSKALVRESIFGTGLVTFSPTNLTSIGCPDEFFKGGEVAIVNLKDTLIRQGDSLVVKKQDEYFKVNVESLMLNDLEVESVENGEVGIKVSRRIKKNSELFVEKK